jgi:hypothetical protein
LAIWPQIQLDWKILFQILKRNDMNHLYAQTHHPSFERNIKKYGKAFFSKILVFGPAPDGK